MERRGLFENLVLALKTIAELRQMQRELERREFIEQQKKAMQQKLADPDFQKGAKEVYFKAMESQLKTNDPTQRRYAKVMLNAFKSKF